MDHLLTAWLSGAFLGVTGGILFDRYVLVPGVTAWMRFLRRRGRRR